MKKSSSNLRDEIVSWLGDGKDLYGLSLSLRPKTQENYRKDLLHFERWLSPTGQAGEGKLSDLNLQTVTRYLRPYYDKNMRRSIFNKVTALRSFAGYLHESSIYRDLETGGPVLVGLKAPTPGSKPRPQYTDEHVRTILTYAKEGRQGTRDRAIVSLMLASGGRSNEIRNLNLNEVEILKDLSGGSILVVRSKTDEGENRISAFGADCAKSLTAYLRNERPDWKPVRGEQEPFFVTERGTRFTPAGWDSIRDRLRERLKSEGIKTGGFAFHRCRNKWAQLSDREGISPLQVMASGGWKNMGQMQKYVGIVDPSMLKALKSRNGLDSLMR